MKPIIIDAATIFDPARLLAVLASVDIRHSEVWVSQRYDHFKEKDFITGFGTDSKFALLPDANGRYKTDPLEIPSINEKLNPKSWITGPKILRWALDKGMVVPKDLYKYEELAIELEKENQISNLSEAIMLGPPSEYDIRAGKERTEEYLKRTGQKSLGPEYAWRLEPYGIGHGLGLILAAAQEDGVEPFLSHPNFRDNQSTHNYSFYKRDQSLELALEHKPQNPETAIEIEAALKDASRLLKSPEPIVLSEVAFYLDQKERIDSITGIITASKDLESRNKDIGIIAGKYAGTLIADGAIFGGLPVTTSLVSLYDVGTRYFKSKK
ncbi:TPA: hypothetical protein NJ921_004572 [Vibrio parahaemolyticus]|uniref:hypothetical protein n=1 Tax=Vibrio parahaemolyticus TaxID=670 RepID=UPI002362758A|nr:hypothetical protein [Vibrio parahaemolyticus]EGR2715102.1 hypothetical protein [Vibrio parahaemolyticus]EIZ1364043.1 hypothetical protein [Vibrio vulnificus]HCG8159288.1 hypothetical protein [Vibrio parahaemolyticus]